MCTLECPNTTHTYITLIYWRKLSPFLLQFDNHIILPFTRLKNKNKSRSRVSSQAGYYADPGSLPTRTAHEKIHRQIINSLLYFTLHSGLTSGLFYAYRLHTCYYLYNIFPARIIYHSDYFSSTFHFSQYVYSDFLLGQRHFDNLRRLYAKMLHDLHRDFT